MKLNSVTRTHTSGTTIPWSLIHQLQERGCKGAVIFGQGAIRTSYAGQDVLIRTGTENLYIEIPGLFCKNSTVPESIFSFLKDMSDLR